MEIFNLWEKIPGLCEFIPVLEYYPAKFYSGVSQKCDATVVILPGGGYASRAEHEGKGYADFFNSIGMDAFVCQYRTAPHRYPLPLLDARRAVQFVRFNAEKFGINPEKIGVMGSSAGGHLASSISNIYDDFDNVLVKDQIDAIDYLPNFEILCYPVIALKDFGHIGSGKNLLGDNYENEQLVDYLSMQNRVNEKTPKTFIFHTFDDPVVSIKNSLAYAMALKENNIECEMHIYQNGPHGVGLASFSNSLSQWTVQLKNWLIHNEIIACKK
ncbi:MAG: alpha/beta hydrolase [Ruminococcaceae bacterium]|nr:alpha/beta hydrolase [Oscillospiraceae bacterium]